MRARACNTICAPAHAGCMSESNLFSKSPPPLTIAGSSRVRKKKKTPELGRHDKSRAPVSRSQYLQFLSRVLVRVEVESVLAEVQPQEAAHPRHVAAVDGDPLLPVLLEEIALCRGKDMRMLKSVCMDSTAQNVRIRRGSVGAP